MNRDHIRIRITEIKDYIAEIEDDLASEWDDDLACQLADLKDELKEYEEKIK
jgi:hypothetical protein